MTQVAPILTENSDRFQAHDLVWLKAGALDRQREWAYALPDWALSELDRDTPLIVRRALAPPGVIPVGIRGRRRSQRQVTYRYPYLHEHYDRNTIVQWRDQLVRVFFQHN